MGNNLNYDGSRDDPDGVAAQLLPLKDQAANMWSSFDWYCLSSKYVWGEKLKEEHEGA